MDYFYLFSTLSVGWLFGVLASKIKIPGGLMVGSLIGVSLLNISSSAVYMPGETKTLIQIVAGAFIGCVMEKSDVKRLPKIIKPIFFMLSGFLILNIIAGFLIWRFSPLDLITSLMAVVPGGISDTPIIAADMGADAPKVAVLQIVRQILGIGIFPSMILYYDNRKKYEKQESIEVECGGYKEKRQKSQTKSTSAFFVLSR
jgi:membrane AbrB-like protein